MSVLDGVYLDSDEDFEAVCLQCLTADKATVSIPQHLIRDLEISVRETFPNLTDDEIKSRVVTAVAQLSRTPPVPWIQHNYWPVCHGDFTRYLGEWDQSALERQSETGDGKSYLLGILDPFLRERIGDVDTLWESIGAGYTAIYLFDCMHCSNRIAIAQSY